MIILDPDGLFSGDRLRRCSNHSQLHFPRLLLASDGFGRLELNYARIIGRAYSTFDPVPSEAELQAYLREYATNYLLFIYKVGGSLWGQWDCRRELLPRYKRAADRRSPSAPEPAFTEWKKRYRDEYAAFPKCFGNLLDWREDANRNMTSAKRVSTSQFSNYDVTDTENTALPKSSCNGSGSLPHAVELQLSSNPNTNVSPNSDATGCDSQPAIEEPSFVTTEPDALFQAEPPAPESRKTSPEKWQEDWFAEFWAAYWRRKDRKSAHAAFRKNVRTEGQFAAVMAAVQAQTPEMLAREARHRPYAATWLNGQRWEDEIEAGPVTAPSDDYPELT